MTMNKNWYHKKRLSEQLKFFGAKKTRFISEYAKKPRIRMVNKSLEPVKNESCTYPVRSKVNLIDCLSPAQRTFMAQQRASEQALQLQHAAYQNAMQQSYARSGRAMYGLDAAVSRLF